MHFSEGESVYVTIPGLARNTVFPAMVHVDSHRDAQHVTVRWPDTGGISLVRKSNVKRVMSDGSE